MDTTEALFGLSENHPAEELIERYAMKRVTDFEEEQIEEHLLLCGACREALTEAEAWVALMKQALPAVEARQPERAAPVALWRSPAAWGLGATALAALLFAVPYTAFRDREPVAVALEAYRGAEAPAEAPAGTPLAIRFANVENAGRARVSVVRASDGAEVWTGPAENSQAPPLLAGRYWVRLFTADGQQVKEAGLLVQ